MATGRLLAKLALFNGCVSATGNVIAQFLVARSNRSSAEHTADPARPESKDGTASADPRALFRLQAIPGYDPLQTLRFFVYGASFVPISFRWHSFLNARFPIASTSTSTAAATSASKASKAAVTPTGAGANSGGAIAGQTAVEQSGRQKLAMVLKRVAVDQTVFAPFATGAFVFGMGLLEGLSPAELAERARTQYMDILLAGYALWPAAQLVNFSLVPLAYRVPFGSTVSLFWNTYLGWKNYQTNCLQQQQPSSAPVPAPVPALSAPTPVVRQA
ncbi:hypothetical protein GGI07_005266 [Coemansia sp. Benny D115]|nr:hypothetical protein GGI07_005266 [Coemansia sp. Benny D115]